MASQTFTVWSHAAEEIWTKNDRLPVAGKQEEGFQLMVDSKCSKKLYIKNVESHDYRTPERKCSFIILAQLMMVNWWFGLVVWIPKIPENERDCYLRIH